MKRTYMVFVLGLLLVLLITALASCNPSALPVTAPTLTPASAAQRPSLPPTEPTLLPMTSSTSAAVSTSTNAALPIVTLQATGQPAAAAQVRQPAATGAAAAAGVPATAAAPAQPALDPACLVGSWEVTNLGAALANAQPQGGLALQGVTGRAVYQFGADGNLQITYDRLAATLKGTVNGRAVTAVQSLNGSALAHYTVESTNQQVILSDFGGQGIRVQMEINGQRLAEGNLPAWQAFTSASGGGQPAPAVTNSRAAITCGGNTMTLRTLDPAKGPEVQLKRLQ